MMSRGNEQDSRGWAPAGAPSGHVDEWGELVVDYLDGRLASETKSAVESHLRECPDCAARVQAQQSVVTFLQETALDDPPEDLEYRVLGEMLFPSQPLAPPRVEQTRRGSILWRRKIRPWIPVTVALAALVVALVGFGLFRSNSDFSTKSPRADTTLASADRVAGVTPSQSESVGAALGPPSTTAAAATTTSAGATTTAGTAITAASASTVPPVTQDRKTMVSNLKAAEAPAYVAFEAPVSRVSGDDQSTGPMTTVPGKTAVTDALGTVPPEQVDAVVSQLMAFTGMEPLDDSLSLGGPTFAAYVPKDDAAQLVDLVRSIAVSLRLTVSLGMEPPAGTSEAVARLLERKAELPALSAERVPQPAVSGYAFTTSTLVPADGPPSGTLLVLPDVAGTHVLVVFYVRR